MSVSAGAYLVKSPAIHRAPAVSFSPNIFAEAVNPAAATVFAAGVAEPL
jgi:hypothetical protein